MSLFGTIVKVGATVGGAVVGGPAGAAAANKAANAVVGGGGSKSVPATVAPTSSGSGLGSIFVRLSEGLRRAGQQAQQAAQAAASQATQTVLAAPAQAAGREAGAAAVSSLTVPLLVGGVALAGLVLVLALKK